MPAKLLLLEDVESLGRAGEIVTVKPGHARNYLVPRGLALVATKIALRRQEKIRKEREKKAIVDKNESDGLAARLQDVTLTTVVKVDHEGRMYGSVTLLEIAHLLEQQQGIVLDKKSVQLKHPIKATGVHLIPVKLKEGVAASFHLKVMSEEGYRASQEEKPAAE